MSCLFLTRLPLEIRSEVYRYFVGGSTRRTYVPKSEDYDRNRNFYLDSPDHFYDLDKHILWPNRQIRTEALELFQREVTLISLELPEDKKSFEEYWEMFRACGAVCLDWKFWCDLTEVMSIVIDDCRPALPGDDEDADKDERKWFCFAVQDLPDACAAMQRIINELCGAGRDVKLYIKADQDGRPETEARAPASEILLSRCLEPLRSLRGASHVEIESRASHGYMAALVAAMTERRPSAAETMGLVAAHFDDGDGLLSSGDAKAALAAFRTGYRVLSRGGFDDMGKVEKIVGGRYDGLLAGRARDDAKVQLHTKVASAYLALGEFRFARIYVERIYGRLHSLDDRYMPQKFPLRLPAESNATVYAELLVVAARISMVFGNDEAASYELSEAGDLHPGNQDVGRLEKECEVRREKRGGTRYQRRRKTQQQKRRKYDNQLEEAIQVAQRRILKADAFLKDNKPLRAHAFYEAASQKLQAYSGESGCKSLQAQALTKAIWLVIESQDLEAVRSLIDRIFALQTLNDFLYKVVYNPVLRYEVEYAIEAYYAAFYCNAVILQKQGEVSEAIENFKWALGCDEECYATYYQLEYLKEIETEEDRARHLEKQEMDSLDKEEVVEPVAE